MMLSICKNLHNVINKLQERCPVSCDFFFFFCDYDLYFSKSQNLNVFFLSSYNFSSIALYSMSF